MSVPIYDKSHCRLTKSMLSVLYTSKMFAMVFGRLYSGESIVQERVLDQQSSSTQASRGLWVAARSFIKSSWRRRGSDVTSVYSSG